MFNEPFPIPEVDERLLFDLSCSRIIGPVITLAQEINLFKLIDESPQTIEDAAKNLRITPIISEAFMVVLAAFGLLERQKNGRFCLTKVAKTYMIPDSPFYYTGFCPPHEWYLDLLRIKLIGGAQPPMPMAVAMNQHKIEMVHSFIDRMHMIILPTAANLAKQPVFAQISHLLDAGGGSGALAIAIAAFNSQIQCTVMDLEPVCEIAQKNIAKYGLEKQITTVARDMFKEAWPGEPDGVLFGNVFHDWDLEHCYLLARRAFDVLKSGGKVLLHEMPLHDTKDGPLTVACLSAILLMYEKGKQYTLKEIEEILSSVGFIDFQSTPTHTYYHLISAKKP
ncbi:methyltransferase [Microcoleus sp. OTE_8_concoct_300]|uniref:methyltransferase n=1 Tax=Microcoleus sp. OTE_8_concoct_300 TaxID=2964710 RepID=UPI00403F885B